MTSDLQHARELAATAKTLPQTVELAALVPELLDQLEALQAEREGWERAARQAMEQHDAERAAKWEALKLLGAWLHPRATDPRWATITVMSRHQEDA